MVKVDGYIKMAARKTKLAVDWIVTTTGHGSEAVVLNFRTACPNIKKALVVKNFRTSEAGSDPTRRTYQLDFPTMYV